MTAALDIKQAHIVSEWAHDRPLISCRFEPQGRYVFAGAEDNTVQRWALADGVKTPLVGHESWVKAIAFSKDGETTITGGSEGRLIWWPTAAEQPAEIRRIDAHQGWIRSLSVSPDGEQLLSSGEDGVIHLWDIERAELMRTLRIDRPYERMDIRGMAGISETQRAALIALGAIERSD